MDISALIQKMALLFFVMLAGFVAAKRGVLNRDTNQAFSSLIVNVTNPLQILASVMTGERLLSNLQVLELTAINAVCYVLLAVLGLLLVKILRVPEKEQVAFRLLLLLTNTGFLGYPLAEALLGPDAKFCITIFVLCFNVVCWTYGSYLLVGKEKFRFSGKIFLQPCVFCAILAYIIYLTGIQFPPIVGQALSYIGDITGQLAMVVIGVSLAQLSWKTVFGNWRVYVLCVVKMILMPLLFWAALRGLLGDSLMLSSGTLVLCMPVATSATILCYRHGQDDTVASSGVFLSTLLSMVTLPLMMWLLFS